METDAILRQAHELLPDQGVLSGRPAAFHAFRPSIMSWTGWYPWLAT